VACALYDAKRKNNSGKASLMFFRFAVVLRAFSKWGVPQTPESNTKVLLMVARCAKLWFWIRATSLVPGVTKPGCTNSSATWFCYADVAAQCLTQSGKQQQKSITLVFRFALVASRLFWIRSKALISTTKAGCTKSSATGFCCAAVLRAG